MRWKTSLERVKSRLCIYIIAFFYLLYYYIILHLLYVIHLSIEKRITDLSQKIISLFRSHVSWRLSDFSAVARRKVTFPIFQRQRSISGSLEDERRKMVTTTMARMSQELRERSSPLASTRMCTCIYMCIYVYTCVYNFIVSAARPRKRSGARAMILSNWFREFSVKRFDKVAGRRRRSKKLTHTGAAKVRVGNNFNYLVELSPLITRTRVRPAAFQSDRETFALFAPSGLREFSLRISLAITLIYN